MTTRIVVPCYEEADRLDVAAFDRFLGADRSVCFTLVNDGSRDATLAVLRDLERRWPERVRVIDQQPNRGKAEAVRVGVLDAIDLGADRVGYWDADLATPLEAIDEAASVLDRHADIDVVLGARVALLGRRIDRRWTRHYSGRVFATAASLTLGLPVYDTQCGAKLFRVDRRTRGLFEQPFLSRWIFDVELIARYLQGTRLDASGLYELPLKRWADIGDSKVRMMDFVRAVGEMARIYRRYSLLPNFRRGLAFVLGPLGRYALAGGVGTAGHYGLLTLLVEVFALAPTLATAAGAAFGAVINYVLNYHFVFSSAKAHREAFPRFITVAALGLGVNAAGMWILNGQVGLHYLLAQLGCTGVVLLLGFLLNRVWTFEERDDRVAPRPDEEDDRVPARLPELDVARPREP